MIDATRALAIAFLALAVATVVYFVEADPPGDLAMRLAAAGAAIAGSAVVIAAVRFLTRR